MEDFALGGCEGSVDFGQVNGFGFSVGRGVVVSDWVVA